MNEQYCLNNEKMEAYALWLRQEEHAPSTVEKYLRDIRAFALWLDGQSVTKERTAEWKSHLQAEDYAPVTINGMLTSVNGLLRFLGWEGCRVKHLKLQRKLFQDSARVLTRADYDRLLETAHSLGRERLALLMETICATGIRVSEVRYITVEAAQRGRAEISMKGKIRVILIPGKLARKLLKYARKHKTVSGEIFLTGNGKPLSRRQIWAEMKALCAHAGVEPSKVFPHALRHLFARAFYKSFKDIAKLADLLSHSSIETTRIYLLNTGEEHARQLERLGLVS